MFASFGLILLFGVGTGMGGMMGVPPAAEDPVLANVAPEKCLFYTTWSGTAKADPASKNHVEQLMAEKEVQQFLGQVEKFLVDAIRQLGAKAGEDPRTKVIFENLPLWAKTAMTRPACIYVESVELARPPKVKAGLVMGLGDKAQEIAASLEKMQSLMIPAQARREVEIGGGTFHQLTLDEDAPPITWGVKGKYLLVGVGQGVIEDITRRMTGQPPAWHAAIGKRLPIERRSTLTYVDVKSIMQLVKKAIDEPQAAAVFEAIGADNITTVTAVTGLDKTGFAMRGHAAFDGQPKGLIGSLVGESLTDEDLAVIPRNSTVALAARIDGKKVVDAIKQIMIAARRGRDRAAPAARPADPPAENGSPGGDDPFGARPGAANAPNAGPFLTQPGADSTPGADPFGGQPRERDGAAAAEDHPDAQVFTILDKLFSSLGDRWRIYSSPHNGGLLTGWTAVASVRDREALMQLHDKMLAEIQRDADRRAAERENNNGGPDGEFPERRIRRRRVEPHVHKFVFAGRDIYYMDYGRRMPIAPAWCITDDEVIVGLFPQTIKGYLTRDRKFESLLKAPEVDGFRKEGKLPSWLVYYDSRKLFETFYPMVQMVVQSLSGMGMRMGIDLDPAMLPSAAAIGKHLRPSVAGLWRVADGLEWESRQSLPGGNVAAAAPVMAALLLPAIQSAQDAAKRAQSMINMRNVLMALQVHQQQHKRYPAQAIADQNGKPLLSWRVQMLPYLDQQNLYDRFKKDEPWDSPHNKQLLSQMPKIYRSPKSQAPAGYTNYLAVVKGNDSVIYPGSKVRPADIRDGMSNTLLLAEVDDSHAVPWTKPEDFTVGENNPMSGLGRTWPRQGQFIAGFADGSIHMISRFVDPSVFRSLVTRAGGENVDFDDLDGPRRGERPVFGPGKAAADEFPGKGAPAEGGNGKAPDKVDDKPADPFGAGPGPAPNPFGPAPKQPAPPEKDPNPFGAAP